MLRERVLLRDGLLIVEFESELRYTLRYGELVEYSERGRRVRGRSLPYRLRSVEQLRYDFEEDLRRVKENP
jgi:hypothetical protein